MGAPPGHRSGLGVLSPTLLGAVVREGEMQNAGAKGLSLEVARSNFRVRGVRVGGILPFRGSFLEGAGSATKCFLPGSSLPAVRKKQLHGFPSRR